MLVELLSKTSGIQTAKLMSLAETASNRYKVYTIPKRTGGNRLIEHPSRELKAVQRWLVRAVFARFPIHEAATAYRKGAGIRANAERHQYTRFTNRFDFKNFFPSFSADRVRLFVREQTNALGMELSERDLDFVVNIVCRHGRLTIGAPSSPAITNAMMFAFDQRMHHECEKRGLIFTRYADDIFVSSSEAGRLGNIGQIIAKCKREIPHLQLRLNQSKTAHLSKKYRRTVTGVVITPQNTLSIGRERKREIKSLIHRWIKGELDGEKISYLRGLFAFAIDIEPDFEERLVKKYGADEIRRLRGIEAQQLSKSG